MPPNSRNWHKLSNFANNVTSIASRDSLFVAKVESVVNFYSAIKKEHSVFCFAACMEDIVEDFFVSQFLSGNNP